MSSENSPFAPLPEAISRHLRGGMWRHITLGLSQATTYQIQCPGQTYYLKIANTGWLRDEYERTQWLAPHLPVPRVVAFAEAEGREFLLVTEIPGTDASSIQMPPERLVVLLAEGLRQVHSVPIEACPFDLRLDVKIEQARYNVVHGLVDEGDLDESRQGLSAERLMEQLTARRPVSEDLLFTHGDYCLPNIIISGDRISGFIDLGRAGIADRYQDLALAARSIEYNLGTPRYLELFFRTYGITEPDWEKIEYYQMLDEFF